MPTGRWSACAVAVAVFVLLQGAVGSDLHAGEAKFPKYIAVEQQPFVAATQRLLEALEYVGDPLSSADQKVIQAAYQLKDAQKSVSAIQKILDKRALVAVHINAESRVSVGEGPAKKELVQQGWRTFLVKVNNEAGITPKLVAESPNAAPLYMKGKGSRQRPQAKQKLVPPGEGGQRFLDISMFEKQPMKATLSGLEVEYLIIQIFSRDVGKREAKLAFNVGQGTQDIGFRNAVPLLFNSVPAVEVSLGVHDFDGKPTMASFIIRDQFDRVYPNPARRLAPDFFFHNQIYREDGESIHLPPGEYSVTVNRGPEYHVDTHKLIVKPGQVSQKADFKLRRWVHPAKRRWFSGDHHVHAAGCQHYDSPTEGVTPADMMRHILGEDLNVGCVLSWGPCWYTQKQYFEGKTSALSRPNYLMRYDVEVSGFPSGHAGHLCLLRLSEDDYEGTKLIEEWPSWTLPILAWGKKQGGVVGYSHSGWGLALPDFDDRGRRIPNGEGRAADKLPDYAMPPFDGIGANEYIVTVTQDVCDFISTVDTPSVWELNVWYHTLNCGYRTRISGETDFPCIYGDKVGLGRIYVSLPEDQELNFDNWIAGLKDGRSYCGDGLSHVMDFKVNDVGVGEPGSDGKISHLDLKQAGKVKVEFDVSAMLAPEPTPATEAIRNRRLDEKPYWHLERSRIDQSRTVPVEIVVNGYPVATKSIVADGKTQHLSFDVDIDKSSWVTVRILPSVHTNPVFVEVGGKPIRASRRSAQWCLDAVNTCWDRKKGRIGRRRPQERKDAEIAYQKAREIYAKLLEESVAD